MAAKKLKKKKLKVRTKKSKKKSAISLLDKDPDYYPGMGTDPYKTRGGIAFIDEMSF